MWPKDKEAKKYHYKVLSNKEYDDTVKYKIDYEQYYRSKKKATEFWEEIDYEDTFKPNPKPTLVDKLDKVLNS